MEARQPLHQNSHTFFHQYEVVMFDELVIITPNSRETFTDL